MLSFPKTAMNKLDVQQLLQTARERTGLSDFGPPDFMEGLEVLVSGINNEAQIADERFNAMVETRFLRVLMNRLWFAKDLADHPEILDEDIGSPVIIASLPRTGSTKLHRMLGAAPDFQTMKFWHTNMFARIPGLPDGGRERRIQETRDLESWMYKTSPGILTGHPPFTDEPEEDQWLMEFSFRHPFLFGMYQSVEYAQWIGQADMTPTFNYFLQQLKYLQWQEGSRRGSQPSQSIVPWLLKTPNHLGNEEFLTRTYKKPRFIITHRDPAKCVPSVTYTAGVMRKLYSHLDSTALLGAATLELFSHCASVHLQWRDSKPDVEILDLGFREVTEDGIGTARKVYDFLGMEFTPVAEKAMRDWESDNPKDKHGKGVTNAASIGTTDEKIRERFAPYMERFAKFI